MAVISGWATIAVAIALNPWFNVAKGALSDLGAVGAPKNRVFNVGLTIAGTLSLAYAACLANSFKNRLGAFASGVYSVAAAHLILVAIFPSGTEPHAFISIEFFVLTGVSMILIGLALIKDGLLSHGALSLSCSALGFFGSAALDWPSTAILEIYNITLITAWVATMAHRHLKQGSI